MVYRHTCRQNIHSHKIKIVVKKHYRKNKRNYKGSVHTLLSGKKGLSGLGRTRRAEKRFLLGCPIWFVYKDSHEGGQLRSPETGVVQTRAPLKTYMLFFF